MVAVLHRSPGERAAAGATVSSGDLGLVGHSVSDARYFESFIFRTIFRRIFMEHLCARPNISTTVGEK